MSRTAIGQRRITRRQYDYFYTNSLESYLKERYIMSKPDIRPDVFSAVGFENTPDAEPIPVNAKYDRVDVYRPLGLYMLKFFTDDRGLVTIFTDEEVALRVVERAELPLVERDFIFQSEYEGHLVAEADRLTDEMFELDIDEGQVLREMAEEARQVIDVESIEKTDE